MFSRVIYQLYQLSLLAGVKLFEGVGVKSVQTVDDKVSSVETTHGDIKCDYFVNCTGMVSLDVVLVGHCWIHFE